MCIRDSHHIVRHLEDMLLLNKFFTIVDTCLSGEDIARQICAMVPDGDFWRLFLRSAFPASRVQHISDLHSKFVLRPHKETPSKIETTGRKLSAYATHVGHNNTQ